MRDFWFNVVPTAGDIKPTAEFPSVFGVIMDWPGKGVISTVIALADGTSSVYTTHGIAIMGGYGASQAATELVRQAERRIQRSKPVSAHPYPEEGTVFFYIRTYDGLRLIEEKTSLLKSESSEHTPLFVAANRIMTELFQASGLLPVPSASDARKNSPKAPVP